MTGKLAADRFTLGRIIAAGLVVSAILFAAGWLTREDPGETPYLRIAGKSFIFNYRVSDAYYGFTAYLTKTVPRNSEIIASFENPAGGEPFIVSEKVTVKSRRYSLRSPSLHGIEAKKPYEVRVKLVRFGDNEVLFDERFTVSSNISDEVVPEMPLTIGPGYHKNPALKENGS